MTSMIGSPVATSLTEETLSVSDLALLPHALQHDFSDNSLTRLPDGFCTLAHIVRLDLSDNRLEELPPEFGDLHALKHLNLFRNLIPPIMGQIDFTPILGFMVLQFLAKVLSSDPSVGRF